MQEFHVGLPCLKLSLNPSNQRHHGKAARTCSVGDAWREMNDERRGRDKTIDHSLTKDNIWLCGNTDMDMEGVIQAEIDRINGERAEYGKRKMRVDAVSAIELIQKPPMELMETLTREEQIKLLEVSDEVTESILHDWKPDWNPIATVIHFDEFGGKSGHSHKIFMPIARDDDGCPVLNAKRDFNLKFFTFMNREYPARMRERGYPVLDCEIYEDMTEEQREEHKEKKKDYGLEGYEYKQKKAAEQEARIKENEQLIDGQEEILSDQKGRIAENEGIIAKQDDKISKGEQDLNSINQDVLKAQESLKTTNDKIEAGKTRIEQQKEESKELGIRILSKKQVLELKEPPRTFDGQHYKVPIAEYNNVKATAGQVNEIKKSYEKRKAIVDKKEKALVDRSADLDKREKDIENMRKLPIKDKMELEILRKLKRSIKWLSEQDFVPNVIRRALQRALGGEDLSVTQCIEQPRKLHEIAR